MTNTPATGDHAMGSNEARAALAVRAAAFLGMLITAATALLTTATALLTAVTALRPAHQSGVSAAR